MQCNIDARGKLARLIWGIVLLAIAVAMLILRGVGVLEGAWPWWLGGALAAGGAFAVFEARQGWCVMRAMGFKTPM